MGKAIKSLFGGLDLTWLKVLLAAVVAGAFTAAMAIIPAFQYTSFHAISVTFEVWILFGILIIMNSKNNIDSALKCFVFFLISQPLVYLIQVPFSWQGWGLFRYYKYWFIWTVLCLPMGYIGYYMKQGKWWGYLILFPMIALTAFSYYIYFSDFLFYMPKYSLICLFCVCAMIVYPIAIFANKRIRAVGVAVSAVFIIALTVFELLNPPIYSADIMSNTDKHPFDDSCSAYLEDARYGEASIRYDKAIEDYILHVDFKKAGKTVLSLVQPDGEKTEYELSIKRDTYEVVPR